MTLKDEIAAARDRLEEIRYGPGATLAGHAKDPGGWGGEVAMMPGVEDGRWIPAIRRAHAAASAAGYVAALPAEERRRALDLLDGIVATHVDDEDARDREALDALEALITEAEHEAALASEPGTPSGIDADLRQHMMTLLQLDEDMITPNVEQTLASFGNVVMQARADMRQNRAMLDAAGVVGRPVYHGADVARG